jgi:hypothetical protein
VVFLPVALSGLVVNKPAAVKSVCFETYPLRFNSIKLF